MALSKARKPYFPCTLLKPKITKSCYPLLVRLKLLTQEEEESPFSLILDIIT